MTIFSRQRFTVEVLLTQTQLTPGDKLRGRLLLTSNMRPDQPAISVRGRTYLLDDVINLQPGMNTFSFSSRLPRFLPPTDQHANWTIVYSVRVYHNQAPCGVSRLSSEQPFTVRPFLDLARDPFHQASTEAVRQNGFVHRGADVISATVILERTGWVLGERIPLRARVDNFCETMAVRETRFALRRTRRFRARGKQSADVEETVTDAHQGRIQAGQNDEWNNAFYLRIPNPLLPTGLLGCPNIWIDYAIQMNVIPDDDTFPTLTLTIPVVIGTVGPSAPPAGNHPRPPGDNNSNNDNGYSSSESLSEPPSVFHESSTGGQGTSVDSADLLRRSLPPSVLRLGSIQNPSSSAPSQSPPSSQARAARGPGHTGHSLGPVHEGSIHSLSLSSLHSGGDDTEFPLSASRVEIIDRGVEGFERRGRDDDNLIQNGPRTPGRLRRLLFFFRQRFR